MSDRKSAGKQNTAADAVASWIRTNTGWKKEKRSICNSCNVNLVCPQSKSVMHKCLKQTHAGLFKVDNAASCLAFPFNIYTQLNKSQSNCAFHYTISQLIVSIINWLIVRSGSPIVLVLPLYRLPDVFCSLPSCLSEKPRRYTKGVDLIWFPKTRTIWMKLNIWNATVDAIAEHCLTLAPHAYNWRMRRSDFEWINARINSGGSSFPRKARRSLSVQWPFIKRNLITIFRPYQQPERQEINCSGNISQLCGAECNLIGLCNPSIVFHLLTQGRSMEAKA